MSTHRFISKPELHAHARAIRGPVTDAEWAQYWRAQDLAAEIAQADRTAALPRDDLQRPLPAESSVRVCCPIGNPYAGRP